MKMKMIMLLPVLAACLLSTSCAPEPDVESPAGTAQEKPEGKEASEASSPADEPDEEDPPEPEPPAVADEEPETEDTASPPPEETPQPDADEKSEDAEEATDEEMPSYKKAIAAFNEVQAGDKACEQGDIDTAIKHYEKALKLAPEAPKHRFAYAQLLYWKGLGYMQQSQTDFQKSLGASSGESAAEWLKSPATLSDQEKQELANNSEEARRRGMAYMKRALEELTRCDADWSYSVEAVAFAKGIVNVMMERFAYAVGEFKRVLESERVDEKVKSEVKNLIEKIESYQKELKEKEEAGGREAEGK